MIIGVSAMGVSQDTPADTGNMHTELLFRMCRQHPEHTFLFFFDRPVSPDFLFPANVTPIIVPLKGPAVWLRKWWLQWQLPRALKKQGVDLFLGMDGMLPLRSKIPAVLFLKDLSFLQPVAGVPQQWQRFFKKETVKYIASAKKIVLPGAHLEQPLLQYAPAAAGKVQVIPAGIHESYQPLDWEQREVVKKMYTGGTEYFLVTGSLDPRNNIMPLLKAFSALKRRQRSNMKLVLAGKVTAAGQEIANSLQTYKFRQDVVLLPDLDQPSLANLTAAAYAMVYTTRLEGAALPVYAALRCQVPVIAIDSPAAREAGKEALLYADPENLADLAEKLSLLYKDEVQRSRQLQEMAALPLPGSWDTGAEALLSAALS
ncbi:Glycosyltransferase involved in cell wall bisynthesis [Chitinophaga rupis]|uniref:Glycosyltransferase involved in cell wall bisynthesis n=1 Tax=Chitinophaga rupis TaxID=573321 RepID=A0A1H7LG30_9BACT|nr:glycosyltransferase [Chitinophaga rupis]SEK97327.1 Glycosyltransferase involved in cell wall bisynthesis [Chitinophaga rupis]